MRYAARCCHPAAGRLNSGVRLHMERVMDFRLFLREIDLSDIGRDCRYLPDEGEFEMHYQAIADDIATIAGVTSATTSEGNQIHIHTVDADLETLKIELKPFLLHHFQYLRISKLIAL